MMHASLMRLAALPPETRVYFGHEYTASNLRFAAAVEPDNPRVAEREKEIRAELLAGQIGEDDPRWLATRPVGKLYAREGRF